VLDEQAEPREVKASRLAFEPLEVADGAALEAVEVVLRKLAAVNPERGLRELGVRAPRFASCYASAFPIVSRSGSAAS